MLRLNRLDRIVKQKTPRRPGVVCDALVVGDVPVAYVQASPRCFARLESSLPTADAIGRKSEHRRRSHLLMAADTVSRDCGHLTR